MLLILLRPRIANGAGDGTEAGAETGAGAEAMIDAIDLTAIGAEVEVGV
jgi:hypothetical protein